MSAGPTESGSASSSKPRARLGPIETVHLPASDSEPEDDDDDKPREDGQAPEDPNFLKDHPGHPVVLICPTVQP